MMGCGSSKEIDANSSPDRKHPHAAGQVSMQQSKTSSKSPSQGHQQQRQVLAQVEAQHELSPSSASSTIQVLSASGTWPKVIRLGAMSLVVHVHAHNLTSSAGQMPCWTFISQGLSNVSQPEVVLTVVRRRNENVEAFPETPLEWIRVVYALADNGMHLDIGQVLELVLDRDAAFLKINGGTIMLEPSKWQAFRRFGSFLHGILVDCYQFPSGTIPPEAHHVIALTPEETAVATQFGVTRVLGHLGSSVRWFPHPPWIDRDREDTVTMADQGGSIRINIPIARIYGLNAMLCEDDVVLTIPAGEEKQKMFKDYVLGGPLSTVAAFDSFMTAEADSGFTWKKGQTDPTGYGSNTGQGKNLNLAFLFFTPQQNKDETIMCEDGYAILLRDSTWSKIRDAIASMQDITVPLENDKRFTLRWKHSVFHNPIDGGDYTANWRTYHSSGPPKPPSNSHIELGGIVFLIEPQVDGVDTEELAQYVKQIHEAVKQKITVQPLSPVSGNSHPGRQLVIEIELPKREGWLKASAYPSMDGLDIQGILENIGTMREPEAREVAKFQLFFNLWGYQEPAAHFS